MNELNQISKWKGKNKLDNHTKIKQFNKKFFHKTITSLETLVQYSCNGHCIRRDGEPTNWLCIDIDAKFDESFEELVNLMKIKPAYILPSSSYSEELTYKLHCLFELKEGIFSKDFEKFYHEFVKSVLPEYIVYDKRLALYTQNMFGCNETFNKPLYIGEGYSYTPVIELEDEITIISKNLPFTNKDFRSKLGVKVYNGYHYTPFIRYKSKVLEGYRNSWIYVNILKAIGAALTINNELGIEEYTLDDVITHCCFLYRTYSHLNGTDNISEINRSIKTTCVKLWTNLKDLDVNSIDFAVKCCANKNYKGEFKTLSKTRGTVKEMFIEFLENNCLVDKSKLNISLNNLLKDFNNSISDNGLSVSYMTIINYLTSLNINYDKDTKKVVIDEQDIKTLSTKELMKKYNCSLSTIKRFKKGSPTKNCIISNTNTIIQSVDGEPLKKQEIDWSSFKKLDTTNRDFKRKVKQRQEHEFNEC